MTHEEIESREIAESYVRGHLSDSERAAFEDHCYSCDECFDQVQLLEKFVIGVRNAAESGLLPETRLETAPWYRTGFYLAFAASLMLAFAAGWFAVVERPRLLAEAARERDQLAAERTRLADMEKDLAGKSLAAARLPNLPLIMLDAVRADSAAAVVLPPSVPQLAVWVEPPPAPAGAMYRIEFLNGTGQIVETVDALVRNSYGALAAAIPAARMAPGSYRARLYLSSKSPPALVGEYRFDVRTQGQ